MEDKVYLDISSGCSFSYIDLFRLVSDFYPSNIFPYRKFTDEFIVDNLIQYVNYNSGTFVKGFWDYAYSYLNRCVTTGLYELQSEMAKYRSKTYLEINYSDCEHSVKQHLATFFTFKLYGYDKRTGKITGIVYKNYFEGETVKLKEDFDRIFKLLLFKSNTPLRLLYFDSSASSRLVVDGVGTLGELKKFLFNNIGVSVTVNTSCRAYLNKLNKVIEMQGYLDIGKR